jgi:glycosidase
MPTLCPHQILSARSRRLLRILTVLAAACTLPSASTAQTLARPGWVGSGLTPNSWWRHAVIYEVEPRAFQDSNGDGTGDLRGITQRLDYLQSLGVDALLLDHLQPASPASSPAQPDSQGIDPVLGSLDDFDDLVIQASRHKIRILIELAPDSSNADLSGVARFWLNRGIAGLRLPPGSAAPPQNGSVAITPADNTAQLRQLQSVARSYVGERVLIGNRPQATSVDRPRKNVATTSRSKDAPLLLLDPYISSLTQLDATSFRAAMEKSDALLQPNASVPVVVTEDAAYARSSTRFGDGKHDVEIGKLVATLLLSSRGASIIDFGQEIGLAASTNTAKSTSAGTEATAGPNPRSAMMPWGLPASAAVAATQGKATPDPVATTADVATEDADPQSLLNWYRQLTVLQHSSMTLRSGTNETLNHDDQHVLAWVRKPQNISANTPPLVFVCNLSAQPVQLSLKADMLRLHLRGSFLRTVLRSDNGMGPMHLDSVSLPPFAVYIGELRY